ncbi:MAG: hypothetical protein R2800_06240 [Flavipsychrobacter sp.]
MPEVDEVVKLIKREEENVAQVIKEDMMESIGFEPKLRYEY